MIDTLTHLLALAAALESEGQYNNAKLLRAAVDSLLTREASEMNLLKDKPALLAESGRAMEALSALNLEPVLLTALELARAALAENRLPGYVETPDPFVCRTCGHLAMENLAVCPVCGAHAGTFKRFRPIYWIDAFDPFEAVESLRSTPETVADLLSGLSDARVNQSSEGSGWSLRQAITHLRDAQGVLALRVKLILDHENPVLESKAVFEWATNEGDQPSSAREIFETYRRSRVETLSRLESLPFKDWWRRGRHEEFGELKLYQQVSYFACHELTHLPQLTSLAGKKSSPM